MLGIMGDAPEAVDGIEDARKSSEGEAPARGIMGEGSFGDKFR
jgi:hypothetical protein